MIGLLVQYVGRMLWGAAVVHSLAPPNRRFTVPKQNRRFTVPKQNRRFTVPKQNRRFTVD